LGIHFGVGVVLALDLSMFWLFRCFIPVNVLSVDVLSVDVLSLSTFSLISSFDLLSVDVLSVDVLPWSHMYMVARLCENSPNGLLLIMGRFSKISEVA
jgi:hypothetical protein